MINALEACVEPEWYFSGKYFLLAKGAWKRSLQLKIFRKEEFMVHLDGYYALRKKKQSIINFIIANSLSRYGNMPLSKSLIEFKSVIPRKK
jgi:hypothetical protein